MARALTAYLARAAAPDRAQLQEALDALKLKIVLDDDYAPFKSKGYLPCSFNGEDAGFDIRFEDAPAEPAPNLQTALGQMSQVTTVSYVTKDQALADFLTRHPDERDVVTSLPSNPLPASLQIDLRNPSDYVDVADYLRGQPGVDQVLNIKDTVDRLVTVVGILRAGGVI